MEPFIGQIIFPSPNPNPHRPGDMTLGDVVVVRELDKSSVKLQEACANGTY